MVLPNPKNHPFFFLVIFSIGVTVVISGKVPIKKRSLITVEPADMKLSLSKRTFCNAFGCGGKRGELNISPKQQDFYEYEQQGVIDLGDDSADDVARDILAEARLYEALEARNTLKMLQNRRQGFFPRQKRAASPENENEPSANQPGVNPSLLTAKKSQMPR